MLNSIIYEHDNLNNEKNALESRVEEIGKQLEQIPWFMFWKVLERKRLKRKLTGLNQSLEEIKIKLEENSASQWLVRPNFIKECAENLGGIRIEFLNVGGGNDSSNDKAVRKTLDQENNEIIELYSSTLNMIIAKCLDYIKDKIQVLPSSYAEYIQIDIKALLYHYGILLDRFQPDILIRIKSMIKDICTAFSNISCKEVLGEYANQISDELSESVDISQTTIDDTQKRSRALSSLLS